MVMSGARITFSFDHAFGEARKPVSLFLVLRSPLRLSKPKMKCSGMLVSFWFVWVFSPKRIEVTEYFQDRA